MCRMIALTATLPDNMIVPLMDRAMLLMGAEYQRDGWGISFNGDIWKGAGPYGAHSAWMKRTAPGHLMIGHVRNASIGTSITTAEAQPFRFPSFIGTHNGYFEDWRKSLAGYPNSDSFRGFSYLDDMIIEQNIPADQPLTPELINDWITNKFYRNTTFACFILRQDRLYVFRNRERDMFCSRVGRGYLLCTSVNVLYMLTKFMKDCFDLDVGKPKPILTEMLYEFRLDRRVKGQPLDYKFHSYWGSSSKT